jgi:endoglucanase
VNDWWHAAYLTQPLNSPDAKKLPLISVSGNRFVDPTGKPVLFRGVSIADPDKTESQGHWSKELFVKVKETGATVVRIPVHPVAWRARGTKNYLALLDQAVQWCTDLGLYVDIDWHSIGNLKQGLFQDPMYETSMPETFNFWRIMAAHLQRKSHRRILRVIQRADALPGPARIDAMGRVAPDQRGYDRAHPRL